MENFRRRIGGEKVGVRSPALCGRTDPREEKEGAMRGIAKLKSAATGGNEEENQE